jgi:CBS-domain-containing membrane protein
MVQCGQFDQEFSDWQDKNWAGVDLSQLTARDVMVPFTYQWDAAKSPAEVELAIRNSGVDCVPCLDEMDLYLGVLSRDKIADQFPDGSGLGGLEEGFEQSIMDQMETPITVREDLPYAELMDHFTADDQQMVVVLRNEQPLGYVTHAALASLLESVDHQTFRSSGPVASGADYLLVSDLMGESVPAEAVHA